MCVCGRARILHGPIYFPQVSHHLFVFCPCFLARFRHFLWYRFEEFFRCVRFFRIPCVIFAFYDQFVTDIQRAYWLAADSFAWYGVCLSSIFHITLRIDFLQIDLQQTDFLLSCIRLLALQMMFCLEKNSSRVKNESGGLYDTI